MGQLDNASALPSASQIITGKTHAETLDEIGKDGRAAGFDGLASGTREKCDSNPVLRRKLIHTTIARIPETRPDLTQFVAYQRAVPQPRFGHRAGRRIVAQQLGLHIERCRNVADLRIARVLDDHLRRDRRRAKT